MKHCLRDTHVGITDPFQHNAFSHCQMTASEKGHVLTAGLLPYPRAFQALRHGGLNNLSAIAEHDGDSSSAEVWNFISCSGFRSIFLPCVNALAPSPSAHR